MILYGLPACDTCRKAKRALEAAGYRVELRDVRKEPLSAAELSALLSTFGDALVNRRSTTWRNMPAEDRAAPADVILERHPAAMKRPVCQEGERISLGWDDTARGVWRL